MWALLVLGVAAKILQPKLDTRTYDSRVLTSGLQVLYVQDTASPLSGYAMAVDTGSLQDPEELPGLAHLLEHVLFLGTEKFPVEGEYDSFLAENGGESNAFTDEERTVFYADFSHEALDGALDRFSQFYIAPLLDSERVDREVAAVNAEHEKNIGSPERRAIQLLRDLMPPSSPSSHFYTGNSESLLITPHSKGINVSLALRGNMENYYCAERMHLVVLTNRTVDEQHALVEERFGEPAGLRRSCSGPKSAPSPLEFRAPSLVRSSTEGQPKLVVGWALGGLTTASYRSSAWSVVEFVLTSEAKGSWLPTLREQGLATDVSTDGAVSSAGTLGFAVVTLTEEGSKKPEQVLGSLWNYVGQKVGAELVESMQKMSLVDFDQGISDDSVSDAVSRLAEGLSAYAVDDVLAGGQAMLELDIPLVDSVFSNLTAAHSSAVLLTPDFHTGTDDQDEKWYRAKYHVEALPTLVSNELVTFPPPIPYVPDHLHMRNETSGSKPESVAPNAFWQGQGHATTKQPKAHVYVKLGRVEASQDAAQAAALGNWAAELIRERAADVADGFTSAGLNYDVTFRGDALQLHFFGYDEFMPEFIEKVLSSASTSSSADKETFETARSRAHSTLGDLSAMQAYEHALEAYSVLANTPRAPRHDVVSALSTVSVADLEAWLAEPVAPVQFYYGNMNRDTATKTAERVRTLLGASANLPRTRVRSGPASWRLATPAGNDTVALVVFQKEADTVHRAQLNVLAEILRPRLYDELRTQQSLGYIVDAFASSHLDVVEFKVVVQGQTDPATVVERIDASLANAKGHMAEDLDGYITSVRTALKTDVSMENEARRLWGEVHSSQGCFSRRADEVVALDKVTAEDLEKALDDLLKPERRVVIELAPGAPTVTEPSMGVNGTLFAAVQCSAPLLSLARRVLN